MNLRIKLAIAAAGLSFISSFLFSSLLGMIFFIIGVCLSASSLKSRYAKLALTLNLFVGVLQVVLIVYLVFNFSSID
ncbi:hypothetical protein PAECIP111891_05673 [Paenibacillus allorhizoplanae]|uniref:DUF4190 domain-containing protein n=1 Tax=Paenibacillus allorhizoplanae TaxID=2905648 RepID=A0ABM9CU48_9BACL|nr:hypothetical protein [Paenibacillus allorhizoplanae]CAH1224468.1 hypothetical protein PAECIP111891_05673 [Paenibacillus allorhizoplanae]